MNIMLALLLTVLANRQEKKHISHQTAASNPNIVNGQWARIGKREESSGYARPFLQSSDNDYRQKEKLLMLLLKTLDAESTAEDSIKTRQVSGDVYEILGRRLLSQRRDQLETGVIHRSKSVNIGSQKARISSLT